MTPKKQPANMQELRSQLKLFRVIQRDEIPAKQRASVIGLLPIWDELEIVRGWIVKHEIAPFEEAIKLDLNDPDLKKLLVNPENGKPLRQARQAILTRLRDWLKKSGMDGYLTLVSRGNLILLAGKGDSGGL